MLASLLFFHTDWLRGDENEKLVLDLFQNGNRDEFIVKDARRIYENWYPLLTELYAWDSGAITVTLSDYKNFSESYKDAKRIFDSAKAEYVKMLRENQEREYERHNKR